MTAKRLGSSWLVLALLSAGSNLVAEVAQAGSIGSAGGRAVVCFKDDGKTLATAESLDTYEGRIAFSDRHLSFLPHGFPVAVGGGRVLPLDLGSVDSILAIAKARLARTAYTLWTGEVRYDEAVDLVGQRMRFVADGSGLQTVDDSLEVVTAPPGCVIAQAVVFLDPENILVDGRIWSAMAPFDRAALIVHEALYWLDRIEGGQEDSRYSRRAVSRILGAEWPKDGAFDALPKEHIICASYWKGSEGGKNTLLAFYRAENTTRVRVGMLNGQRSLDVAESRVSGTADFPFDLRSEPKGQTPDLLFMAPWSPWTPEVTLELRIDYEPDLAGRPSRVFWISGHRSQYPSWTMNETQMRCYPGTR